MEQNTVCGINYSLGFRLETDAQCANHVSYHFTGVFMARLESPFDETIYFDLKRNLFTHSKDPKQIEAKLQKKKTILNKKNAMKLKLF